MIREIPLINTIEVDFDLDQLASFSEKDNNDVSVLRTTGIIINYDNKEELETNIVITSVFMPLDCSEEKIPETEEDNYDDGLNSNIEERLKALCVRRIIDHFFMLCTEDNWIMYGYFDGKFQVPFVLIYHEFFNLSVYAISSIDDRYKMMIRGTPSQQN